MWSMYISLVTHVYALMRTLLRIISDRNETFMRQIRDLFVTIRDLLETVRDGWKKNFKARADSTGNHDKGRYDV